MPDPTRDARPGAITAPTTGPRAAYAGPTIRTLGSLAELTEGAGGSGADGMGHMSGGGIPGGGGTAGGGSTVFPP